MYIIVEKIIGLIFFSLGSFVIYSAYYKPIKFLKALNFRAYIFGVGFVIIGIAIIVGKYHILDVIIHKLSN